MKNDKEGYNHSQANLKSNSLMAIPKAWNRLSGYLN